jgi:hypothetical protein
MTTQDWLIVAGAAVAGAAAVLAAMAMSRRVARRFIAMSPSDLETMRRTAVRLRRLQQVASAVERRLEGHVDDLRRFQAMAQAGGDAPAGTSSPQDATRSEASPRPMPHTLEKQRDHVIRLRRQGLEPMDIARRLRMPVGEVELTLTLHDRQAAAPAASGGSEARP